MLKKLSLFFIISIFIVPISSIYGKKSKLIVKYFPTAVLIKTERQPKTETIIKTDSTSYSDDLISIVFSPSGKQIGFRVLNKTKTSMSIIWDECVFVNHKNIAGKIMHQGIKYMNRNNPMAASIIPAGVQISDMVVPTDNVYYRGMGGVGWDIIGIYNDRPFKEKGFKKYGWNDKILFRIILVFKTQNQKFLYNFYFTTKLFKFSRTKKRGDWESITEVK